MAKLSKRVKALKAKVDRTKTYAFDNAVALIKECATGCKEFLASYIVVY